MRVKLRPHHLLCTQGFRGNGYDEAFIANMTEIVNFLRSEESAEIEIVFGADSICEKCPNLLSSSICSSEERVRRFDRKVTEYFKIEEKSYIYSEITARINKQITAEIAEDICAECSWFADCAYVGAIINRPIESSGG
jgi:hypothetical protein